MSVAGTINANFKNAYCPPAKDIKNVHRLKKTRKIKILADLRSRLIFNL
jgi:hypothetical protein